MEEVPRDRRYSREHEWAREKDGRIVVGITHYAQDQLGDVVFVGLPDPGTAVTAGRPLGEIESTKSVSDIYSPVDGTIADKNRAVEASPQLVNDDPYDAGWLVVIDGDPGGLADLLDADAYARHIGGAEA